jgi:hemolysin activation/secretion protein
LNRQFLQSVLDERRTGGLARVEVELFRNLAGQQLSFDVEGRRATVDLLRKGSSVSKTNLTTLDIGGRYLLEQSSQSYPRRLRLEPVVRWRLGASATETTYARFSVTANYHQQMLGPTEFDLTGTAGVASAKTPAFELLSLGGDQTIRGFRKDDVLARRLWSLQPEIWAPVPGVAGATQGAGLFLRQNARLAFFVDVGGVYKTLGPLEGTKAGPGLGIRLHYGLVVLKLDWAKAVGNAATEGKWGRFYFNVMTTRAF